MPELLCVFCISNRATEEVRQASTVVAGLAVCRDEVDSDHYDIAWSLLAESTRHAILKADIGPRS